MVKNLPASEPKAFSFQCMTKFTTKKKKKNLPANAGDAGDACSIPGSGRSPGEGNGNPLQYSCLGNPVDRGARRATVHGVVESGTTERLSTHILL